MPPSLSCLMPLSKGNQLRVSCIFIWGKNYFLANTCFKNFLLMESHCIHSSVPCCFCYLCLIRSFCIRIYRNTSLFLMTVWYSNVGMCYKCSNTDGISGFQYFTTSKPYCSEHTYTYNEIIPMELILSNRIADQRVFFIFN